MSKQQQQQQFKIASKYLIERSSYFTKYQLVLSMQESGLYMQPLSRDREEKEGFNTADNSGSGITKIEWDSIVNVSASERNLREFTISTLPPNRRKLPGNKQGNPTQHVFTCKERNRLLTEIVHKLHIMNYNGGDGGQPELIEKAWHHNDIFYQEKESSTTEQLQLQSEKRVKVPQPRLQGVVIKFYPTVIQVVLTPNIGGPSQQPVPQHMRRKTQQSLTKLNRQSTGLNQNTNRGIIGQNNTGNINQFEENKQQFEGVGTDADGGSSTVDQNHQNKNINNFQDMSGIDDNNTEQLQGEYYDEDDDEMHIEDYDSNFNQGAGDDGTDGGAPFDQNTLLTPFKGSMLGGTVIGEGEDHIAMVQGRTANREKPNVEDTPQEGAAIGGGTERDRGALRVNNNRGTRQHFIYLCEIDRIFAVTDYLIIIKKNKEIEKFIFKNEDSMRGALNLMKKNYKEYFKSQLFYFNFQDFEKHKIFDEVEFLRKSKNVVYSQDVTVSTWDGFINNFTIELDESYIYEVQKSSGKVKKRCLLIDLEMVRIQDKQQYHNLVLLFKKETEMVLNVPSLEAREKLLSTILTLRSFTIPLTGFVDPLTILINQRIDFSQRILGLDPLETASHSYMQEYEGLLFRKVSENINYKDSMKINNLIEEILLNATFASLGKIDTKHIRIIVKEIQAQLESYLSFEICEPQIVDQVLGIRQHNAKNMGQEGSQKLYKLIDYFGYKKIGPSQQQKQQIIDDFAAQQNASNNLQQDTYSNIYGYNFEPDSVKSFELLYEQTAKYLNVLHLFLNSKLFMSEMAEFGDLMLLLIKVLASKSPYLSLLSSQVLKAMIHHYSGSESKIEGQNKRVMIRGPIVVDPNAATAIAGNTARSTAGGPSHFQSEYNQQTNQPVLSLNSGELGDNLYLMHAVLDYLTYFEQLLESEGSSGIKPLHLFSICNLLRSIFSLRRNSTAKEELQIFAHMMAEEDQDLIYAKAGFPKDSITSNKPHSPTAAQGGTTPQQDAKPITQQQQQQKQLQQQQQQQQQYQLDDPMRNKPMFHLVDKFLVVGEKSLDVQYMFTLCLSEGALTYFKKYEVERLHSMQHYCITYSIQFIWQIYLLLESQVSEQRKLSIQILSRLLYQNTEGIQLLLRCFPRTLIERVDTPLDLLASLSWQEQEWTKFFNIVQYQNFDSATEQWNNETRNELKAKLQSELRDFIEAKRLHKIVTDGAGTANGGTPVKELLLPSHEFNRDKKVISRWKNLKWNYMEFQVKYACLNHKYLVWKYYLTKLLVEANLDERIRPYFSQKIDKPVVFWHELKIRFMSSFDKEEQRIILKCMCVLYNTHFQSLRQLKSLSYFLKLLDQEQFQHCHFILLQLVHVSLSIKSEYAPINMRKFIKAEGLRILLNCMKLVFKELLIKEGDMPDSPLKNSIYRQSIVAQNYENNDVFDGQVVQPNKLMADNPNYTNSDTNSRYFRRNSEYVCMGILSLKILDLIFKEMVSIDYVPLPSNREFLMRQRSLATLTQMLMIENTDLTREITIFIQMHLDNHYSFYKLRNSGMIEFLILGLNTRNGDRALNILEKFQEVCIDYNTSLKYGLFNSNDLKMIQEDKLKYEARLRGMYGGSTGHIEVQDIFDQNQLQAEGKRLPILAESIFLRYLPIPFIKFLYEKGKQQFLQIYKMQFYESPILIWNAELRLILETAIKDHGKEFIVKLQEFAQMPPTELVDPENMPIYKSKFKNIVKYPQIESEVRCGRYYLRVWINQKKDSESFFKIPREEEDEFYKNLQAELRYCIYEEQFADSQKIIIIFKSCLLALYTFEKKRILYLDEVKRILMDTCKNQNRYNDTVKEMVYIGIKIIYNAFKLNTENLKEILTKNGVEIIVEIFTMILKYSFSDSSQHLSDLDQDFAQSVHGDESHDNSAFQSQQQQVEGNNVDQQNQIQPFDGVLPQRSSSQKIRIDRIEAKTLSLCVQSFNIILNTDVQAFVDLPLNQRINLFKQISRIFDLGFSLLPLFKQRQLTSYDVFGGDSKTYNSSIFNMQSNLSPKSKGSRNKSRKSQKRKQRSQSKKSFVGGGNGGHSNAHQLSNISGSAHNAMQGVIIKSLNEKLQAVGGIHFNAKVDVATRKKVFKKDPSIDYKNQPLLKIIKKYMDNYSISLIFDISRSIFELTREITKNPILHPELIASGMAWKAIQHIQFYLKEEVKKFRDLDISIKSATVTLKNLISFAHELASREAESFAFKNLTRETEKEIMMKFWICVTRVFGNKILQTLLSQFTITNGILGFPNFEPRKFLRQFAVKEEKSPELVWNDETRQELAIALNEQILNLPISYYNVLENFEYTINQKELRVENIFVRHFNTTNDFKPQDMLGFSNALVSKLKEFTDDGKQYIADLSQPDSDNCIELVKAFKNLLIQEHLLVDEFDVFQEDITTFCNLIKVKNEDQLETQRLKEMSHLVLEIIKHISKTGGIHFEYLKDNMDFIRLLIRALYGKEKEIVDMDDIITILQNILIYDELDVNLFLIRTGLIYFMLNQIFDKTAQKKVRVELTKLILQTSQFTAQVYRKYIPQYFFVEIQSKYNSEPEVEKLIAFIQDFDLPEFENVFIIWTNQLRREGHERIKSNCKKIIESLDNNYNFNFQLEEQELYNPYLEHEIRVCDVILRIYNKNPAVFINTKLNTFILNVSLKLQNVAQELFKLGQVENLNFDSDQGFGGATSGNSSLTPNQTFLQKKFKYLCHQSLLMLTSILLSIEQLLFNDFNQNRLMANKKEDKNAETKFYKQIIEKTTEQTQLDHKVYPILGFWLQTQVFLSKNIPVEIRITFLQIIYLIIDVADAVKVLKDNQSLMQFITDSIEKIHSDRFSKTIEEALILFITQKMLRRDSEPTPSLITTSLTKLVKIYEKKKKLRKLIEYILGLMANDQQYKQSVVEYIKQNQLASKMDMKIILENHNQHSEHTEAIQRIWRAKPTSSSDAKRYYDFHEGYYIEDKLDEVNILKIKLPLLSKKSIQAITKEEVVHPADEGFASGSMIGDFTSNIGSQKQVSQGTTGQSSTLKAHQGWQQQQQFQQNQQVSALQLERNATEDGNANTNNNQAAAIGGSNQMSAKDVLAQTLGFQPMLNNDELDLEPIEKIAEDDHLSEGDEDL